MVTQPRSLDNNAAREACEIVCAYEFGTDLSNSHAGLSTLGTSSSPTAVGPIFPPLLLASATPSIYASGSTSLTYNKDVRTAETANEVKQQVLVPVPTFVLPPADVDEQDDVLESRPTATRQSSVPLVLESPHRRPTSTSRRRSASRRPTAKVITTTYVLGRADEVLESEFANCFRDLSSEIVGAEAC